MSLISLNDFKARLKAKNPEGWYIFAGEEDYLKNFYSRELAKLVSEDTGLDVFNYASWNAHELDLGELGEAIQSPPMMQEYKLVEWRFANLTSLKERELKIFKEEIFPLKKEFPSSVFIIFATPDGFDAGDARRPTKLARAFGEAFDILVFPKSTDNQLLSWLKKHFDSEGIAVSLEALNTMLGKVGHSMEFLNNEVAKLSAYLHANGQSVLTPEIIELVCTSNIENDSFALKNSIYDGNIKRALNVIAEMKTKRTEPQVIVAMIASIYSELSAISLLSDEGESFDSIAKLLGISEYPLKLGLKAAKKHGTKKINAALRALIKTDASAKFGGIAGYQAVELFLVQNL